MVAPTQNNQPIRQPIQDNQGVERQENVPPDTMDKLLEAIRTENLPQLEEELLSLLPFSLSQEEIDNLVSETARVFEPASENQFKMLTNQSKMLLLILNKLKSLSHPPSEEVLKKTFQLVAEYLVNSSHKRLLLSGYKTFKPLSFKGLYLKGLPLLSDEALVEGVDKEMTNLQDLCKLLLEYVPNSFTTAEDVFIALQTVITADVDAGEDSPIFLKYFLQNCCDNPENVPIFIIDALDRVKLYTKTLAIPQTQNAKSYKIAYDVTKEFLGEIDEDDQLEAHQSSEDCDRLAETAELQCHNNDPILLAIHKGEITQYDLSLAIKKLKWLLGHLRTIPEQQRTNAQFLEHLEVNLLEGSLHAVPPRSSSRLLEDRSLLPELHKLRGELIGACIKDNLRQTLKSNPLSKHSLLQGDLVDSLRKEDRLSPPKMHNSWYFYEKTRSVLNKEFIRLNTLMDTIIETTGTTTTS